MKRKNISANGNGQKKIERKKLPDAKRELRPTLCFSALAASFPLSTTCSKSFTNCFEK
jgi:hypothetical protein